MAAVHTPPLPWEMAAQVQLSLHYSHDDEDKAISGCTLWPSEGQPLLLVWALLLVRAVILLISALIPANRAIITVYSINVCTLMLIGFAVCAYRSFTVAIFDAVWFVNFWLRLYHILCLPLPKVTTFPLPRTVCLD